MQTEVDRQYNCSKCSAPVKIVRKGGHPVFDPDRYEFDGVDLSPLECWLIVDTLPRENVPKELWNKLALRAKQPNQPGRQYETRNMAV